MTYNEISAIFEGIESCERNAFVMLCVAKAVKSNIDLSPYDTEGFNEICKRIHDCWVAYDCAIDIDDFCFAIQDTLDNDDRVEFINNVALSLAWVRAVEMVQQRLG